MKTDNAILITDMILRLTEQLSSLASVKRKAEAEGRDVSDAEVRAAADQAQAAIDELRRS